MTGASTQAATWGEFYVYMAEPGYVAIRCPCGVWDQFPYFEGRVDFKNLADWADDHRKRYGAEHLTGLAQRRAAEAKAAK